MNKDERLKLTEDIGRISFKILEIAEQVTDDVTARRNEREKSRSATARKPAHVARRQIANLLRTSQFCASRTCHRAQCCRGEPLHCLQSVMPLLPPESFAGLLKKRRKVRRLLFPGCGAARAPISASTRVFNALCEVVRR